MRRVYFNEKTNEILVRDQFITMKRIKPPKTFNRPRLYYQPANSERRMYRDKDQLSTYDTGRLRIIYPDRKAEWFSLQNDFTGDWHDPEWEEPCWYSPSTCKNGNKTLQEMQDFDRKAGYPEAIFLGEL